MKAPAHPNRDCCLDWVVSTGHFPDSDLTMVRHWCDRQSAQLPANALRIAHALDLSTTDADGQNGDPMPDGIHGDQRSGLEVSARHIQGRQQLLPNVSG